MDQELRALQGTRYGKGDEERRSDVGGGKDEPTECKLSVRRWGVQFTIACTCFYLPGKSNVSDIQSYSAFTLLCLWMFLSFMHLMRTRGCYNEETQGDLI